MSTSTIKWQFYSLLLSMSEIIELFTESKIWKTKIKWANSAIFDGHEWTIVDSMLSWNNFQEMNNFLQPIQKKDTKTDNYHGILIVTININHISNFQQNISIK